MNKLRAPLACLIVMRLLPAADPSASDAAIIAALRREAPQLANAAIIRRIPADDGLDVVLAMASRTPQQIDAGGRYVWTQQDRLGLFLQSRSEPSRVYRLAVEPGPNDDCSTSIERMTADELVLSCIGEKWSTYENQKFVFNVRAKALVSHFSYQPFWTAQVIRGPAGPRFVMANNQELALVDGDGAGALSVAPPAESARVLSQIPMEESSAGGHTFRTPAPPPDPAAAFGPGANFRLSKQKNQYGSEFTLIVENAGTGQKSFPLPQSDLRTWLQARPDDAKNFAHPNQAEMNEEIGPHQMEGGRLWFGKTFYNSEGETGVGGFGYFDPSTAAYRLYSPPEIQRWSVSAILVETDSVWLALYRRGEYGNAPGGLLRWDRKTETAQSFAIADIVTSITSAAKTGEEVIYLGATDGIVVLNGVRIARYFVDRAAGGRYMMSAR
jgi:hypothetical protein